MLDLTEAMMRLAEIGKLHRASDNGTGRMCLQCLSGWPCPTFKIVAGVDGRTR